MEKKQESRRAYYAQKSKWEEQKDKLRLRFPELTNADVDFDQVREDEMLSRLANKLNSSPDELRLIMESL